MSSVLDKIKNAEKNQDIFILGNAPSIRSHNLNFLKGAISIGINASTLLEDEYDFTSPYYTVSDMRFLQEKAKRSMATEMSPGSRIRVFRKELVALDNPELADDTAYVRALKKHGFSRDLNKGYYFGSTTVMLAIQLSYYLGAKNIYLMGVDLKYSGVQARFYKEKTNQEWDCMISDQISSIKYAHHQLAQENINLWNCSKLSHLTPHIPLYKL